MQEKTPYILDACAVIAMLEKENGSDIVMDIIRNPDNHIVIHAVTLLEVYYNIIYVYGQKTADDFLNQFERYPIEIDNDLSIEFIRIMGLFKTAYKISLGDTFVVSLAKKSGGTIVSSDHHEFETIEKSDTTILFLWFR